jgi:hypothetical protein
MLDSGRRKYCLAQLTAADLGAALRPFRKLTWFESSYFPCSVFSSEMEDIIFQAIGDL